MPAPSRPLAPYLRSRGSSPQPRGWHLRVVLWAVAVFLGLGLVPFGAFAQPAQPPPPAQPGQPPPGQPILPAQPAPPQPGQPDPGLPDLPPTEAELARGLVIDKVT